MKLLVLLLICCCVTPAYAVVFDDDFDIHRRVQEKSEEAANSPGRSISITRTRGGHGFSSESNRNLSAFELGEDFGNVRASLKSKEKQLDTALSNIESRIKTYKTALAETDRNLKNIKKKRDPKDLNALGDLIYKSILPSGEEKTYYILGHWSRIVEISLADAKKTKKYKSLHSIILELADNKEFVERVKKINAKTAATLTNLATAAATNSNENLEHLLAGIKESL